MTGKVQDGITGSLCSFIGTRSSGLLSAQEAHLEAPDRAGVNRAAVVVVYHPKYLVGSSWLKSEHPFELDRALKVEALLRQEWGDKLDPLLRAPRSPATLAQLAAVHEAEYLRQVRKSPVIARIIEVHALARWPSFFLRKWFVNPTLWCVAGTVLAAREALREGLAFNLGGGFHHAKRTWGEGFCLFSDVALMIHTLRAEGSLAPTDQIFYIDLDAHQGNGVSTDFAADPAVRILDIFNSENYPFRDKAGRAGIDVARPLPAQSEDTAYMEALASGLDELFADQPLPRLVIYCAGTDVLEGDPLGDLKLSHQGINRRDTAVWHAVRGRGIPMVVLPAGGYSKSSARLIADFVQAALQMELSSCG